MTQRHLSLIITAVLQFVFWSVLGMMLLFYVPRMQQIHQDFETPLPVAAQVVIQASHIFAKYWYSLVPLATATLIAELKVIAVIRRQPRLWSNVLIVVLTALPLILSTTALIVLYLPMLHIIDSLK